MVESKFYKQTPPPKKPSHWLKKELSKLLVTVILTLSLLIAFKLNNDFKQQFNKYVYNTTLPFAKVKEFYQSYFGDDTLDKKIGSTTDVFSEKLTYSKKNLYKDGVALTVTEHYMVPSYNSGVVVFIGEKEHYQNTVIVQQMDGVDVWYGNMDTMNIKLYDYVEKGALIGEVKDKKLYMAFQKEGKFVDYKDYLE